MREFGAIIPSIKAVVIGGDFNTNHDQAMFAAGRTLADATFDFIFARGLTMFQPTIIRTNASDHWPVTRSFALH